MTLLAFLTTEFLIQLHTVQAKYIGQNFKAKSFSPSYFITIIFEQNAGKHPFQGVVIHFLRRDIILGIVVYRKVEFQMEITQQMILRQLDIHSKKVKLEY